MPGTQALNSRAGGYGRALFVVVAAAAFAENFTLLRSVFNSGGNLLKK